MSFLKPSFDTRLEDHLIFKVPQQIAERVKEMVDSQDFSGLALSFGDDGRSGKCNVDGQDFAFTIVDLPRHVETYKTVDHFNVFKSADISQMLLIHPITQTPSIQHDSGITPPTHKIRKEAHAQLLSKYTAEELEWAEAELARFIEAAPDELIELALVDDTGLSIEETMTEEQSMVSDDASSQTSETMATEDTHVDATHIFVSDAFEDNASPPDSIADADEIMDSNADQRIAFDFGIKNEMQSTEDFQIASEVTDPTLQPSSISIDDLFPNQMDAEYKQQLRDNSADSSIVGVEPIRLHTVIDCKEETSTDAPNESLGNQEGHGAEKSDKEPGSGHVQESGLSDSKPEDLLQAAPLVTDAVEQIATGEGELDLAEKDEQEEEITDPQLLEMKNALKEIDAEIESQRANADATETQIQGMMNPIMKRRKQEQLDSIVKKLKEKEDERALLQARMQEYLESIQTSTAS